MEQYRDIVIDTNGRPVPGISVAIQQGGVDVVIYSDNGITPKVNPVVTDIDGIFQFYAPDGTYQAVANGETETIYLLDPSSASGSAAQAAASAAAALVSAGNAAGSATASAIAQAAAAGSAAQLAAAPTSYDNTRDPLATDDSSVGAVLNSPWYNSNTEVIWECVDSTVGGAVWRPLAHPGSPGMRTGNAYPLYEGIHNTGSSVPAADTIFMYPFSWPEKVTLTGIIARIVTGGASSNLKAAIYTAKGQRPVGAPVVVNNTGVATATSNQTVNLAVAATLKPGEYFICVKFGGAGAVMPQPLSISSTDYTIEKRLGRASTANGNTALTGMSLADAYANSMPTFTGSESWVEVVSNGVPIIRLAL